MKTADIKTLTIAALVVIVPTLLIPFRMCHMTVNTNTPANGGDLRNVRTPSLRPTVDPWRILDNRVIGRRIKLRQVHYKNSAWADLAFIPPTTARL